MAWVLHAAARGLSREQIEHEILNSRDLSKEGSAVASAGVCHADCEQAIALSSQWESLSHGVTPESKQRVAAIINLLFVVTAAERPLRLAAIVPASLRTPLT